MDDTGAQRDVYMYNVDMKLHAWHCQRHMKARRASKLQCTVCTAHMYMCTMTHCMHKSNRAVLALLNQLYRAQ
jgi:hypothetical protein